MSRVQQLVALLYPPKWRARYGRKFSALLERLEPRTGDLLNLFTGAIRMHMTEWGYLKFAGSILRARAAGRAACAPGDTRIIPVYGSGRHTFSTEAFYGDSGPF